MQEGAGQLNLLLGHLQASDEIATQILIDISAAQLLIESISLFFNLPYNKYREWIGDGWLISIWNLLSKTQMGSLNACRIYLQVKRVSNITTADGKHTLHCILAGKRDHTRAHPYNSPVTPLLCCPSTTSTTFIDDAIATPMHKLVNKNTQELLLSAIMYGIQYFNNLQTVCITCQGICSAFQHVTFSVHCPPVEIGMEQPFTGTY
jgi:hypothetical protein